MYDIIIIGAGAAGLAAAVEAIFIKPDIRILILEKNSKSGRKLSASGNGKCNLTNSYFASDCYLSNNTLFVENFIDNNSPSEVVSFFEKCGIMVYEKGGYYYPLSDMAKQVTSKLLKICSINGVTIEYDKCATDIKAVDGGNKYIVKSDDTQYESRIVIIAAGSSSYPGLGGSDSGYDLIKRMNIDMTPVYPVLIPIYVDDDKLSIAQGVRISADITIDTGEDVICERGQIQINKDNLSGIAIMNISCYLPAMKRGIYKDCIFVDYCPYMSWDELKEYIIKQCDNIINDNVISALEGVFPNKFARYLLTKLNINPNTDTKKITEKQINRLTSNIKRMRYTPIEKFDNDKSQASLGGVDLNEIAMNTYESKKYKGLYIVGEMLDITGKCGGYNLTFAFISGINAACDSVKHL